MRFAARRNYLIAIRTFRLAPMGVSADRSSRTSTRSSRWTKRVGWLSVTSWHGSAISTTGLLRRTTRSCGRPQSSTPTWQARLRAGWPISKPSGAIWLDCDGGDLRPDEFAAMFPHLTMVLYNSASSTTDAPRWRAVIPTTCAMTIDVHRDILMQLMKSLNQRGYHSKKQLEKREQRGLGGQ